MSKLIGRAERAILAAGLVVVVTIGMISSAGATLARRNGALLMMRASCGASDLNELWISGPHRRSFHKIFGCLTVGYLIPHARFSPSGKRIALIQTRFNVASQADVYTVIIIHQDGTGERVLRRMSNPPEGFSFSPNGRVLAYSQFETNRRMEKTNVSVISLKTGDILRRFALPGEQSGPIWSPTGELIFVSFGVVDETRPNGSHRQVIPITFPGNPDSPKTVSIPTAGYAEPPVALSPDGSQIAMTGETADESSRDIYLVGASGGRARRLTHSGRADFPVWSPDGQQIAFRVNSPNERMYTLKTRRVSTLTNFSGFLADWRAIPN